VGDGDGEGGRKEECGPTLSVAISSLLFLGGGEEKQLTKIGTIE